MSRELQRRLAEIAERTGKGKNAILVEALTKYLETLDRAALAVEARRQSERVSRHEQDESWYELADPAGWR
jgi:predicted DNA-binding protein